MGFLLSKSPPKCGVTSFLKLRLVQGSALLRTDSQHIQSADRLGRLTILVRNFCGQSKFSVWREEFFPPRYSAVRWITKSYQQQFWSTREVTFRVREKNWSGAPAAFSTSALLCPPAVTLTPAAGTRSKPPAQLAWRMLRMKAPRASQGNSNLPKKLCAFVVSCIHRYSLLWNAPQWT